MDRISVFCRLVLVIGLGLASLLAFQLRADSTRNPAATVSPATGGYDWLQFNGDPQHSGRNQNEALISTLDVGSLSQVFRVQLPAVVDGVPAYLSNVATAPGVKDLLFVTTVAGDIMALDAHTGGQVWVKHNPAGSCGVNNGPNPCYTTASPAVDPNRLYVYSYGLDGYVHKYQVGDGVEITTGGWPQLATLKPFDEKGSSNLSIAVARNGAAYLYVANGGYPGDAGDYQGHVTAIDLADGSQKVFNANCSDQTDHFAPAPATPDCPAVQSAVWARSGVVYDPDTDRIYLATGNGNYDPVAHDWGDSVLTLNPDGSGVSGGPLDSYTPANYQELENTDADLGSTAPALLPVPTNSRIARLAVQGGKDGLLRLLDLDNLSDQGGPGHTGGEVGQPIPVPQGGAVLTALAVWVNPQNQTTMVFVANSQGISGLNLIVDPTGTPELQVAWQNPEGGTSPIIADQVLYYAASGDIRAVSPVDGRLLWHDSTLGRIHWESPIVANGVLYITDDSSQLTAYAPASSLHFDYLPIISK